MKKCFSKTTLIAAIFTALFLISTNLFASGADKFDYNYWNNVGKDTGFQALVLMQQRGVKPQKENLIALTNAGYAEVEGSSTMGFIDGITDSTGCRRGNSTLAEIHARYDSPLWCAVYDKVSGYCAYLQLKSNTFDIAAIEKINADHLYANAEAFNKKFGGKVFGGNEFRIVTIANALANGAPAYALRSFEYHDHYCPGVTSGIMMVNYIKKNFPPIDGGNYFVQSVQAWCKEDALMTLLNATPGKGGYSALYSTEADRANWKDNAKDASTIIYREDKKADKWDGVVLSFKWADSSICKDYGEKSIMTKLCMDLWYLKKMDKPEEFIKEIKRFELPKGITPKDWAKAGVDPMKLLELTK